MVYVDTLRHYPQDMIANAARRYGTLWSHMYADTLEELNVMAERIGLDSRWIQYTKITHYDVVPSKRKLALQCGAIEKEITEEDFQTKRFK